MGFPTATAHGGVEQPAAGGFAERSLCSGEGELVAIAGAHARVWIVELDRDDDRLRAARALLSDTELARAQAVIDPIRREQLLLARALLRQILAEQLGVEPQRLVIGATRHGRPRLGGGAGLAFSLSHTRGWAAVAVSRHARVGIDIEPLGRRVSSAVVRRVLTPREQAAVMALPSERRCTNFLAHWTAKEACAKLLDGGLAANMHRLELHSEAGRLRPAGAALAGIELRRLQPRAPLVAALAARR